MMKKAIALAILMLVLPACSGRTVIDTTDSSVNAPAEEVNLPESTRYAMLDVVSERNPVVFSANDFHLTEGETRVFFFAVMSLWDSECVEINFECSKAQEGECSLDIKYADEIVVPLDEANVYPFRISAAEKGTYRISFSASSCYGEEPKIVKNFFAVVE